MKKKFRIFLAGMGVCLLAAGGEWRYVAPVPQEYLHLVESIGADKANGILTNSQFKLFASRVGGDKIRISSNYGGWGGKARIEGEGVLDFRGALRSADGTVEYAKLEIGANAFKDDTALTGVLLGTNCVGIWQAAFQGCTAVKRMALDCPEITSISDNTLAGLNGLKELYWNMPKLTSMARWATSFGSGLEQIEFGCEGEYSLPGNPFNYCSQNLTAVFRGKPPVGAGSIGNTVFGNASNMRIYIPRNVIEWTPVVQLAERITQAEFNAKFPGDDAQAIGILPAGKLGNPSAAYLCYAEWEGVAREVEVRSYIYANGGYEETEGPAVTPGYGVNRFMEAGATASAPERTIGEDGTCYVLLGHMVQRAGKGGWGATETNLDPAAAVTVPAKGSLRVSWLWTAGVWFDAGVSEGISGESVRVSADQDAVGDGMYPRGTVVTVTAESTRTSPGSRFAYWIGNVPEELRRTNPLTLTLDKSYSVRAVFDREWRKTDFDGWMPGITDGNWRIAVRETDAESGALRFGNYDYNHAFWGGSGRMNLSTPIYDANGKQWFVKTFAPGLYMAQNGEVRLTELIMPRELETLPTGFKGQTCITNLVIECDYIEAIPSQAFLNCSGVKKMTLRCPKLTEIEKNAFQGMPLTDTNVDGWHLPSLKTIGEYAFTSDGNMTGTLNLPALATIKTAFMFQQGNFTGLNLGSGNLRTLPTGSFRAMRRPIALTLGTARDASIAANVFEGTAVTQLWFVADAPADTGVIDNVLSGTPARAALGEGDCVMYVPRYRRGWGQVGFGVALEGEEAPEGRHGLLGVWREGSRKAWVYNRRSPLDPPGLVMVVR